MSEEGIVMSEEGIVKVDTPTGEFSLSPSIIQNYLVRGGGRVTKQETIMFLSLCKYNKVNPFLNEAYLIKFGSQPAQIVIGKEAFLKRANENPNYRGFKAGVIVKRGDTYHEQEGSFVGEDDILVGGWAEIHTENRIPLKHSVTLSEHIGKKKDGTINSMWSSKPAMMIRKVALCQALREALPNSYQAMYSEEETNVDTSKYKMVEEPTRAEIIEQKVKNPFENTEVQEPEKEVVETISKDDVAPFLQDEFEGGNFQ